MDTRCRSCARRTWRRIGAASPSRRRRGGKAKKGEDLERGENNTGAASTSGAVLLRLHLHACYRPAAAARCGNDGLDRCGGSAPGYFAPEPFQETLDLILVLIVCWPFRFSPNRNMGHLIQ